VQVGDLLMLLMDEEQDEDDDDDDDDDDDELEGVLFRVDVVVTSRVLLLSFDLTLLMLFRLVVWRRLRLCCCCCCCCCESVWPMTGVIIDKAAIETGSIMKSVAI
jgi:hypothetical protein